MFASIAIGSDRDWQPSADDWAQLRAVEGDADSPDFELPRFYSGEPGAASALLLESTEISSLDDSGLVDSIKGFGRLASWAQAMQSRAIAEFAGRRPPAWMHDDEVGTASRYVAEEIACALSLTVRGAENRLDLALRLHDALPETQQAWERGDLDWPRVNVIAERTAILDVEQAGAVESAIVPNAINKTTGQLRRLIDRAVIAADPAAATARHDTARLGRDVTVRPIEDGMAILSATLSVEEAILAEKALTRLAENAPKGDPRSIGQRRADTLMNLITTSTPQPTLRPSAKPLIQIVVAADTLAGVNENPADLDGYGPIPAELTRRLAADATWQRILTDPASGAILDVGRTKYRPPQALADYVTVRERVCGFPPCQRDARRCQIDHAIPYEKGGRTSPDNTGPLCTRHHLLKTHTDWTIARQRDGTVRWTSPTGHQYVNEPEDYRRYVVDP